MSSGTYNGPDLSNGFDCDTVGAAGVWINPERPVDAPADEPEKEERTDD